MLHIVSINNQCNFKWKIILSLNNNNGRHSTHVSSVNKKSFGYASFSLQDFLGFSGCMIVAANVGELDKESNSYIFYLSVALRFLLRST